MWSASKDVLYSAGDMELKQRAERGSKRAYNKMIRENEACPSLAKNASRHWREPPHENKIQFGAAKKIGRGSRLRMRKAPRSEVGVDMHSSFVLKN